MKDPIVCRKVKEVAQGAKTGQTLTLTGPTRDVPPELTDLAVVWSLEPPARDELEALVRRTIVGLAERGIPHELQDGDIEALAEAMQGLSMKAAERVVQRVALEDGKLDHADLINVRQAKAELMEGDGSPLELVNADFGTLDAVGGMDELKRWLPASPKASSEMPSARSTRWRRSSRGSTRSRRGSRVAESPTPAGFDLHRLAEASGGFSGAEIEAGVVSALYRAFGARHDLTTEDILAELAHATPLSRTRAEDIAALRAWASGRATPASSAGGGGA